MYEQNEKFNKEIETILKKTKPPQTKQILGLRIQWLN